MPQVEQVKHRSKKSALVVPVAGGLAVVVIAVVVGVILLMKPKPVDTTKQTTAILEKSVAVAYEKGPDKAIELLKQQLAVATTPEEKQYLYMSIGVNYESKKDYSSAIEAYRQAEKLKSDFGTNEAIARVADASGDKAL